MTIKSGAPLFTLLSSLVAMLIIAFTSILPAAIIAAISYFIVGELSLRVFLWSLAIITLVRSAIPAKGAKVIQIPMPRD